MLLREVRLSRWGYSVKMYQCLSVCIGMHRYCVSVCTDVSLRVCLSGFGGGAVCAWAGKVGRAGKREGTGGIAIQGNK